MNAVIIDLRWAEMRRARMNVKPMSRALALRPFSRALRAGRKVSCFAGGIRRGVNVDQPEKEQSCDGADGKDGGDGGTGA